MALTKIDDRGLTTPIDLLDNEKIRFGTGNDLELYHDGSHSYIKDAGTGDLRILSSELNIQNAAGTETQAYFAEDGAVALYYDGTKTFETVQYGAKAGSELSLYHQSGNSYIKNDTGNLHIGSNGFIAIYGGNDYGETAAKFINDGAVELYYDNSKKFETFSEGTSTTGRATITYAGSSSGKTTLTLGANNSSGSTSLTDSTSKGARVGVYHYTNAEQPAAIFYAVGSDTTNQVNYGGGTSWMNAATHHKFFTADDITTTSGSERLRIDGNGRVSINTQTPHCSNYGVHIKTGDSGVTSASTNRDDIFIEGVDHTGITISTANNKTGGIGFDDPDGNRGRVQYSHSSDKMQIYTSGTNSFEFTDDLDILDGNLKVANGHGIDFSATSDGTGNSQDEIFTDYEKGLWVPTASDGCDGLTYAASRCVYTLIGKKVTLWAKISNPTNVDADTFQIGGLPFTPADHTIGTGMFHSFAITTTRTNGTAQLNPFVVAAGYNVIRLYLSGLAGDDGWTAIPGNFVTSNGDMYITVSYWIA